MAVGAEGEPLRTAIIEDFSMGWTPFVPRHATIWNPVNDVDYAQGPLFQELNGLRYHEGVLQKRWSIKPIIDPGDGTQPPLGYSEDRMREAGWYIIPIWLTGRGAGSSGFQWRLVIVTSSDIWVNTSAFTWARITPVYAVGQVAAVAASSTAVVGIGTTWVTNGIVAGQQIELGTEIHEIAAVNTNTSITLKSAHTAGYVGGDYGIIRTFEGVGNAGLLSEGNIFVKIFNGDLYVAGSTLAGERQPAVLKIPDIQTISAPQVFTGGPDPLNYIFANIELEAGLDAAGGVVPELRVIDGLELMQDGRVILVVQEDDTRVSRFRYSAPTDQLNWTTSPGGFTDIVAGGRSTCTALERLGRVFCIHYHDSIVLGQPTGQDDPPMAFDSTRSPIGAAHHRTIQIIGGRQWFGGHDGSIYAFSGSDTTLINSDARRDRRKQSGWDETMASYAFLDDLRQEYCFGYAGGPFPGAILGSRMLCVNWNTLAARREIYDTLRRPIGVSRFYLSEGGGFVSDSPAVASHNFMTTMEHPGGGVSFVNPLMKLRERGFDDEQTTSTVPSIVCRTLPFDFGFPGVYKVIERVILYMRKETDGEGPDSEDFQVSIFKNGETLALETVTQTLTYSPNDAVRAYHFEFAHDDAAEAWVFEIRPVSTTDMSGELEKIVIRYQNLGEDEALFVEPA